MLYLLYLLKLLKVPNQFKLQNLLYLIADDGEGNACNATMSAADSLSVFRQNWRHPVVQVDVVTGDKEAAAVILKQN